MGAGAGQARRIKKERLLEVCLKSTSFSLPSYRQLLPHSQKRLHFWRSSGEGLGAGGTTEWLKARERRDFSWHMHVGYWDCHPYLSLLRLQNINHQAPSWSRIWQSFLQVWPAPEQRLTWRFPTVRLLWRAVKRYHTQLFSCPCLNGNWHMDKKGVL